MRLTIRLLTLSFLCIVILRVLTMEVAPTVAGPTVAQPQQLGGCHSYTASQAQCATGCTWVPGNPTENGAGTQQLQFFEVTCDEAQGQFPACTGSIPRNVNNVTCCDQDNDGWGNPLCGGSDCNDNNASINPGAAEICGDGIDNDCQGGDELCPENNSSACDDGIDNDQDGFIDCEDPGCSHYGCVSGCSPSQFAYCQLMGGQGCVDGMCYTPVLIDMQGDGIHLTNAQNGVVFNALPGHPAKFAWTLPDSDDAWLALDRNGNGTIDSGEELFGNVTPQAPPPPGESKHGFLALAEYDASAKGGNGDGLITASDAIFSSLQLWQDTNHNGISEPSELRNLSESAIATIECKYKESKRTDEHGNNFRYRAKVKDKHGAQVGRWAWDVFLRMLPQ